MKAKNIPKKRTFPLFYLKTWLGRFLMSLYIVPALNIKAESSLKLLKADILDKVNYTQSQFIRNGVNSQLVPFLIFSRISTSFCFLIFEDYMVDVS